MAEEWDDVARRRETKEQQLAADLKAGLTLQAAKRVEGAWRRRKMMPACPHCGRGISQHDGFGGSMVNREMENRRRLAENKPRLRVVPEDDGAQP